MTKVLNGHNIMKTEMRNYYTMTTTCAKVLETFFNIFTGWCLKFVIAMQSADPCQWLFPYDIA